MKNNIETLLEQWGFSKKYDTPTFKKYALPYADYEILFVTDGENFTFVVETNDYSCRFSFSQLKEIYEKLEMMQCKLRSIYEI